MVFSELPDGVYADDRADDPDFNKRSVSSSELRAHAQLFANLYSNLKDTNDDKFLQSVTPDGLAPWERELFSSVQDSMQSYEIRRANLISKLRSTIGISLPAIKAIVDGILTPLGLAFEILPYGGQDNGNVTGAWVLGVSPLGLSSYLSFLDPLNGETRDPLLTALDCDLDYAAAGLTLSQLQMIQLNAYAYEVQIYGNADATTLSLLNKRLTEQEPARSQHIIRNNATLPTAPVNVGTYGWNTDYLFWWTV
jgi:hypothetical protein